MSAKEKIESLRKEKEEINKKIWRVVKDQYPDYSLVWHTLGHWDCDQSPVGLCIYNHMDDPVLDFCLFCGQPDERK